MLPLVQIQTFFKRSHWISVLANQHLAQNRFYNALKLYGKYFQNSKWKNCVLKVNRKNNIWTYLLEELVKPDTHATTISTMYVFSEPKALHLRRFQLRSDYCFTSKLISDSRPYLYYFNSTTSKWNRCNRVDRRNRRERQKSPNLHVFQPITKAAENLSIKMNFSTWFESEPWKLSRHNLKAKSALRCKKRYFYHSKLMRTETRLLKLQGTVK